jgi:hypothetical protein
VKIKDYYTLEELGATIASSEIFYAIQNRTLVFSFFIPDKEYIAVEPYTGGKVGQTVLSYEGVVSLSHDDSIQLLHNKSLQVKFLTLMNRGNATICRYKYPFKLKIPNSYMDAWCPRRLRDMPAKDIEVVVMGKEKKDEMAYLKHVLKLREIPSNTPTTIEDNALALSFDDALLRHDHLVAAGLIREPRNSLSNETFHTTLKGKRVSQFHELLAQLLDSKPKLSAKSCEAIIRLEHSLSVDEREYDRKGIIVDISDTELVWKSSYGSRQTINLSSLGTILSKVRKRLNTKSE